MGKNKDTRKILILDDEPDIITYFEILLNDHGYETVSAQDGAEGLAKARSEQPDLITLDISMPKKSGIRFYRELKADPELKGIPVVVVTAVTDDAGDPYAFKEFVGGCNDLPAPEGYVPKPVERDDFLAVIERTLAGAAECSRP
jgi:CheY-like chemotaxis protein